MDRRWITGTLSLVLATGALGGASPQVSTPSRGGGAAGKTGAANGHSKPLPAFVAKRERERRAAADLVAKGLAAPDPSGTVTLKNGRFVNFRLQGAEYLTTVLIDFTDVQHGQIPQPNRATDNSTYWSADVSPQHYRDMLFAPGGGSYGRPSMRDYYLEQSSGRFTWTGQVSNWVQVAAPESAFGANARKSGAGGDDLNGPAYRVVDATVQALAASGNYGGIDLQTADQVDRYDCDGDGNFAEPDGYIDHFGIVHAGEGEDAGGGAQGGDAIWSHRWYANYNVETGPAGCHLGGYNLPGTNLWVGDYTDRAGKRRRRRLRARVRARPRPARPVRHGRSGRQHHRLLDPHELRLVGVRFTGLDRRQAGPHGRVGEAGARLARRHAGARRARHRRHHRISARPKVRPAASLRRSAWTCPTSAAP